MAIAADQLGKDFGERHVVQGLSFRVAPGEIYGLIGPNGAGKTTTLRMLAGLMRPSCGSASICGIDMVGDPGRAKRQLGFLGAAAGLYERLTASEVLRYYGELYGLTRRAIDQRVALLAEQLHMTDLLGRRCGELSTGQKQRVSLARTAVHDPPVLILDEPTAGLDVVASQFVAEFACALRQRGRAILLCTHYMSEAELLCDRIGLLYQGRLAAEGTSAELRQRFEADTLEQVFLLLDGQRSTAAGLMS